MPPTAATAIASPAPRAAAPAAGDLSPLARLREQEQRSAACRGSPLGIGYRALANGKAELVFTDLKGEQLVALPAKITQQQFEAILAPVLPMAETRLMLFELAKAYQQRTPIVFEGGTALGKTFVVNTFAKLLYGEKAKIPDFYCNGQTDVSELMGKYVPAGLRPADQQRLSDFLAGDAGAALKAQLMKESGAGYEHKELQTRACAALGIPTTPGAFEFVLGVLPKAMTATAAADGSIQFGNKGDGVLLHIQELGMAAPSVVNALLKIRGDRGKLADDIQVWEDGGRLVEAGNDFFMVFTTNPPGKGYAERFEIDKALARAVVWVNLAEKLSEQSMKIATDSIFSFQKLPAGKSTILDLSKTPELSKCLGEIMREFHKLYGEKLEKGESGRRQKVPTTIDSLWRVAALLQEVQVASPDFSTVDLVATLKCAVQSIYINCLQDKPGVVPEINIKDEKSNSIGAKLLGSFEGLLQEETPFRGGNLSRAKQIELLVKEALGGPVDTELEMAAEAAAAMMPAALEGKRTAAIAAALDGGRNFHGAASWQKHLGIEIPAAEVPPIPAWITPELLRSSCDMFHGKTVGESHMLVLLPKKLSLKKLEEITTEKGIAALRNTKWCQAKEFFTDEPAEHEWALVAKECLPESISQNYAGQDSVLAKYKHHATANARQFYQAVVIHFLDTEERLFSDKYAWLSDETGNGVRAHGGYFSAAGVFVVHGNVDVRCGSLGRGVCRKF